MSPGSSTPRSDESGAAITEVVIITPVLLLMVMVIFHFAVWFHASHVATAAAQEGARAARLEGGTDAAGLAKANDFLDAVGSKIIINRTVKPPTRDLRAGTVRVEVTGDAYPVIPRLLLPVRAVSQSPIEQFRAP